MRTSRGRSTQYGGEPVTRRPNQAPAAPTGPLVDIAAAAQRLGVSVRFVRRLVDERRVPFYKIGRYVRFDIADLDRFAMQGRVEPSRV